MIIIFLAYKFQTLMHKKSIADIWSSSNHIGLQLMTLTLINQSMKFKHQNYRYLIND